MLHWLIIAPCGKMLYCEIALYGYVYYWPFNQVFMAQTTFTKTSVLKKNPCILIGTLFSPSHLLLRLGPALESKNRNTTMIIMMKMSIAVFQKLMARKIRWLKAFSCVRLMWRVIRCSSKSGDSSPSSTAIMMHQNSTKNIWSMLWNLSAKSSY